MAKPGEPIDLITLRELAVANAAKRRWRGPGSYRKRKGISWRSNNLPTGWASL